MTPRAVSWRTCRRPRAAVDDNFTIECDIQLTSMARRWCITTNSLGCLTEGSGALLARPRPSSRVKFKNTSERMMSLGDLPATSLLAGCRLVIEVKSHFDGDQQAGIANGERCWPLIRDPRSACRSTRTRCWRCAN
jgi:hypothetical protein